MDLYATLQGSMLPRQNSCFVFLCLWGFMKIGEPISLDVLEEDFDLEVVTIMGFDNVVRHSKRAAGDSFVEHPVLHHTCAEIPV